MIRRAVRDSTRGHFDMVTAAPRDFNPAFVRFGSWLCENSSARRARRNISKKLRIMESNRAARTMFNTLSENCIFYISQLYEFSHRLGHKRTKRHLGLCPLIPRKRTCGVVAMLLAHPF